MLSRFCFTAFILFGLFSCQKQEQSTLFKLLPSSHTGVDFANTLANVDSLLALSFEYLYNGSGVATGDINNDGLPDLFLTGNKVSSRLYLNKGNLQFEDITESAGVNTLGKWASGITMADVNSDGWLDIYVCVGGMVKDSLDRANILFINQKDNTFKDLAPEYGLADLDYSTQAAWLDYDMDGDLDLYLLTTALDPYSWKEYKPRRINGEAPSTDKLYRNNGDNTFTNVSSEAGILIEGYGLGLGVCDINKDNWPDIYVANDFLSNDVFYINNQDGTFTDRMDDYIEHSSRNGMGTDLQDFNNDGHTDIVVLDMLPKSNLRQKTMFGSANYDKFQLGQERGYQKQYPRNTLQLNNGTGKFSEIGQLAGISKTDWSWSALFADFDNDGWQDLVISNGYRKDITNMDFATYSRQVAASPFGTEETKRKQMMEKLESLPEIKLPNYVYKNVGELRFEDKSKDWGFDLASYSNGMAYADLDNDGDLDMVINNIDQPTFVYENTLNTTSQENNYLRIQLKGPAPNPMAIGAKIEIRFEDHKQFRYVSPYRGYLSSVEPAIHFGLGSTSTVDEILITWPDQSIQKLKDIPANQTITVEQKNAINEARVEAAESKTLFKTVASHLLPPYKHVEEDFVDFKIQPTLPQKHSQNGPGIAVGDVNGDGRDDFFIGGSRNYPGQLFIQIAGGKFELSDAKFDEQYEDMGALFFDVEGDNDMDLYVVSGGSSPQRNYPLYQDRLYINNGKGAFTLANNALPEISESGASVSAQDYDNDGDLDLFVTGRVKAGAYPMPAKNYLLENKSNNEDIQFENVTPKSIESIGMVTSVLWTDFNNDNWMDLLLAGEFMPITFVKNEEGKFNAPIQLKDSHGWWNSLAADDFDKDGDIDYVAGNLGLNTFYEASPQTPVCIYAKDFDRNGRIDPVMCHYVEGKNYIAHSRDMLIEQINSMKGRFKTYTDLGEATFDKSFTRDEIKDAYVVKSETFQSSYIENLGAGNFTIKALPLEAQVAPIFGMQCEDFNGDGNNDILMVGNSFASNITIGNYDACKGVLLLGDGNGHFKNQPNRESGFYVERDAKALSKIQTDQSHYIYLASRNNDELKAHEWQSRNQIVPINKNERFALIAKDDGTSYKKEFYWGATYLSQSSRSFVLPNDVKSVQIFDHTGKSRTVK